MFNVNNKFYDSIKDDIILKEVSNLLIPFDSKWKNIAVNLSGGADSALLTYILCTIIKENNLDTVINIITYQRCWETRPWQGHVSKQVYSWLKLEFPGKIGPGYCTGVGKAMMAFLPPKDREDAIRRQAFVQHTPTTLATPEALSAELNDILDEGVAYDREEHELGIICIAAPILLDNGRVIGALSITTSLQRNTLEGLEGFRDVLLETATNIAETAQNWHFPS